MKYLVFGETIWDVYSDKSVIGGAPFNFSANVALLGGDVYFITGLGRDELGKKAADCIQRYGIKNDFLCYNDKPTGQCLVTLDAKGIPQYQALTDTAYDHIAVSDETLEAIRALRPDVFYFNTMAQRHEVSRNALRKILDSVSFPYVFCDVNIRPGCYDVESLKLCMERASIVKISEEEAHFLSDCGLIDFDGIAHDTIDHDTSDRGVFASAVRKAFPNLKTLVYTMGANGSATFDYERSVETVSEKPEQVEVVSTVGAGDCYSATFIHTYLAKGDVGEAMRAAAARCNVVVANVEAIPQAFLSAQTARE